MVYLTVQVPRVSENVFVFCRVHGGSLQTKPRYDKFVGKQPKLSLYRGLANNYFAVKLNSV